MRPTNDPAPMNQPQLIPSDDDPSDAAAELPDAACGPQRTRGCSEARWALATGGASAHVLPDALTRRVRWKHVWSLRAGEGTRVHASFEGGLMATTSGQT